MDIATQQSISITNGFISQSVRRNATSNNVVTYVLAGVWPVGDVGAPLDVDAALASAGITEPGHAWFRNVGDESFHVGVLDTTVYDVSLLAPGEALLIRMSPAAVNVVCQCEAGLTSSCELYVIQSEMSQLEESSSSESTASSKSSSTRSSASSLSSLSSNT